MKPLLDAPRRPLRRCAAHLALLALLAGCATDRSASQGQAPLHGAAPATAAADAPSVRTPPGPKPWTDAFAERAVVVADHVRIEGPDGLLDHVVVSSDDAFFERAVSHEGNALVQVTTRLSADVPEIRAQLDQWQIAAFERVTVVERLDATEVTVVATGAATFRDPLGADRSAETLRWVGTIGE